MNFKGDIIITDPCYVIKDEHWEKSNYGLDLSQFGFTRYITNNTLYGDWSCSTYTTDKDIIEQLNQLYALYEEVKKYDAGSLKYSEECIKIKKLYDNWRELGRFCADAGMVSVLYLDEVLKYNPEFNYHINRPWTTTLIRDFNGDIDKMIIDRNLHIIGKGNINFFTIQTGF